MTSDNKVKCSVGILTFNSEATLKATLESVKNFAEIIVCDGGSTDGTLALARAFGARVLSQDPQFKGEGNKVINFSGVRNQMLLVASLDWFFYIDSDELMTFAIEREIDEMISSSHPSAAFWVPRKYVLDGEVVECAATYPTKQMRFFHRNAVNGFIKPIHERIEVKSGIQIGTLENHMLVPVNPDPAFHRRKWNYYVELEVARRGKISLGDWFSLCFENAKISALYFFRFMRNLIFCRGKGLPWGLERERHIYNLNLCRSFWRSLGR